MKKSMSFVFAALLAAWGFAAESAESEVPAETRSYGYTPIVIGLATPVQLPWGIDKWDVFGLDLNIAYSDAPKMYGWSCAFGANTARKTMIGLQTAGVFNFSNCDAYGVDFSLFNMNNREFYGLSADAFAMNRNFYGMQVDVLGNMTEKEFMGFSAAGLANVVGEDLWGLDLALGANFARRVHGCQAALFYNQTSELEGAQIGLVNVAFECPGGFQIGLVNVIMDNTVPFLPFVNAYF